jgi:hypothetical protein
MSLALDSSSQSGILSSLQVFYQYSLLMKEAALDKAPWDSPWLCTLFQIEKHGEKVRIKPGTLVYEHCKRGSLLVQSKNSARLTKLSREGFRKNLRCLLWERLNTRISEKDLVSSSLSLFDPCIQPTLHETCLSHHDEASFNKRIRLHLKHVMILDSLYAFGLTEGPKHMERQRSVFTQKTIFSRS